MISNLVTVEEATKTLRDGRTIGYAESGSADGFPIFMIPGYGHSRLAKHPDAGLTSAAGARLISVDLPGLGVSSPSPGYTLLAWAKDARQLLDQLGIDRFSVLGWSWGAPYALAVGHAFPDRVKRVGIVSGLTGWLAGEGAAKDVKSEFRTFGFWCRFIPPAARAFLWFQARSFVANPERTVQQEAARSGGDDAVIAAEPAIKAMLVASGRQVWRKGVEGMFEHSRAVALPWGFAAHGIAPPIIVWHGAGDREILPSMAARLSSEMPNVQLQMAKGRGHLLLFAEWSSIMQSMVD